MQELTNGRLAMLAFSGSPDNGKENGNYRDYRGYIGGDIGIKEKKMETTTLNRSWDLGGVSFFD